LLVRPFDFSLARFRQAHIFNVACYTVRSFCHAKFSCTLLLLFRCRESKLTKTYLAL
jgi:hypothetical protein